MRRKCFIGVTIFAPVALFNVHQAAIAEVVSAFGQEHRWLCELHLLNR